MPDMAEKTPEILRFPAASDWSCSCFAWLPGHAPAGDDAWHAAMRRGVMLINKGPLRTLALKLLAEGGLRHEEHPPSRALALAHRMRLLHPQAPEAIVGKGRLLEVVASGMLDSRMAPLWISLAAACGIAAAGRGCAINPGCLLEFAPRMLTARIPARPMIVLAEHFMVVSSHARGIGRITTHGLGRLGIPEMTVERVPAETLAGFISLVNALAWHVHQQALATRVARGIREVAMPAETLVQPAWREAAFGRCTVHVPRLGGPGAPPPVRMELGEGPAGAPWLVLGPPRGWTGGRDAWARELMVLSGLPLTRPRPPACGHPTDGDGWDA